MVRWFIIFKWSGELGSEREGPARPLLKRAEGRKIAQFNQAEIDFQGQSGGWEEGALGSEEFLSFEHGSIQGIQTSS